MKFKFFLLFICAYTTISSQEISGVVLDQKTNRPIQSVAIYLDNTTKGVITNVNGVFRFDYNESLKHVPLVISHLGYKKIILEDYKPNVKYKFLLEEDINTLDEVVLIAKDPYWTRERKLQVFKEEFLGTTDYGESCVILNEDDINLHYDRNTNQLIANSYKPILIKNIKLGYKLRYDLKTFHVNYSIYRPKSTTLDNTPPKPVYSRKSSYTAGTTFFSDLSNEIKRKILREREKAYKGSALHFMRSLASKKLEKEKFTIVDKTKDKSIEDYFKIELKEINGSLKTEIETAGFKRLNIVYKKSRQSFILFEKSIFTIDGFGNHEPNNSIQFGGEMGRKRIGDILPLDFLLD